MSENDPLIEVSTTTATSEEAQSIARALVEQRLAACVQIAGPIRSCYRWDGQVCEAEEMRLTIKSRAMLQAQVITTIESLHSYDTPEIIVTHVADCSKKYAAWWRASVR